MNRYAFAFITLGFIWGTNFLFMKWATPYLNANQIVLFRVVTGFIAVFIYAISKREIKLNHVKYTHHFFVMSLLATYIYYFCFAKGTEFLPSGIAGALSGAIPIFSAFLSVLFLKNESLSKMKVLGILFGLFGVVLIAKPWTALLTSLNMNGVVYMLAGSFSLGASFVYAKKFLSNVSIAPAALTTYQLLIASILALSFGEINGITSITNDFVTFIGVVVGLGLLGTGIAYIFYYMIVSKLGAMIASTVTYIPPVVAMLIGSFMVNESISLLHWSGMLMILIGVIVMNNKFSSIKYLSNKRKT
ncbi:DMT family transporter [Bacillus kexueae]|uniref:DMT family transporter n=1 Tax=Aeribacillus kexueae TaxID=2078952 RepID=UPI001FB03C60|nr:DMT family transporter [Bacillus kexueae]